MSNKLNDIDDIGLKEAMRNMNAYQLDLKDDVNKIQDNVSNMQKDISNIREDVVSFKSVMRFACYILPVLGITLATLSHYCLYLYNNALDLKLDNLKQQINYIPQYKSNELKY